MQTNSRAKATPAQFSCLVEHMQGHPAMAAGISQTLQGRVNLDEAWKGLTQKLNAVGGPIKTVAKWKQTWRDMRNGLKKKVSHNASKFRGYGPTGNGPSSLKQLSQTDEKVLAVMGPVAVYGMEEVVCTEPTLVLPEPASVPEPAAVPQPVSVPEPAAVPKPAAVPGPVPGPLNHPKSLKRRRRVLPHHGWWVYSKKYQTN